MFDLSQSCWTSFEKMSPEGAPNRTGGRPPRGSPSRHSLKRPDLILAKGCPADPLLWDGLARAPPQGGRNGIGSRDRREGFRTLSWGCFRALGSNLGRGEPDNQCQMVSLDPFVPRARPTSVTDAAAASGKPARRTTPSAPLRTVQVDTRGGASRPLPAYASPSGYFVPASKEGEKGLTETYLEAKRTGGLTRPPRGEVRRVEPSDLTVSLAEMDARNLSPSALKLLRETAYFTSAAGLWSRGGGQVKAIIPYNVAELLSPKSFHDLSHASDTVNASSPADVLLIAKVNVPRKSSVESTAQQVVADAKGKIEATLGKCREDPRALNPLSLKFVNVALASGLAETFTPLDFWTSEQTHAAVRDALTRFKKDFGGMEFHPDPAIQARICQALTDYFAQAHALGETHLFGYQVGFHALDPETGAPLRDTPRIGKGAGEARASLDASGRSGVLRKMGKTHCLFDNIEVLTNLPGVLAGHAQSGRSASFVVVPQQEGCAGGNPFLVVHPGGLVNFELHEQCALPPEFATGNKFFNTNSMVWRFGTNPTPLSSGPMPQGFEVKGGGRPHVRAKENAGDGLQDWSTAALLGRLGADYENFKTYPDYKRNGARLIATQRGLWGHYS